MVNKFVYDSHTSSLAAVPAAGSGGAWVGRALRTVLILAAIGASVAALGFAAHSANGAPTTAAQH